MEAIMMKKVLLASLAVMMTAGLNTAASADTELTVFAAASMTETLNEIKELSFPVPYLL